MVRSKLDASSEGLRTEDKSAQIHQSFDSWELAAKTILGDAFYDFGMPGGEGRTFRANVESFYKWRLVPHVMRDISNRDLSVTLFGRRISAPIFVAPIGQQRRMHPDGEKASARAAASVGLPFVIGHSSDADFTEIDTVMGHATRWFDLIQMSDREVVASILHRAKSSGCSAIVMTVDLDEKYPNFVRRLPSAPRGVSLSDPVFRAKAEQSGGVEIFWKKIYHTGAFTWDDVEFVRNETKLPVLLKGVVNPTDVEEALNHHVDGIIVSNHGALNLDGETATIDALPKIRDAVRGKIPVLMDGGIRSGADIVKALALGAKAVLVGRMCAYGLAVAGEAGVRQVLLNLISETDKALAICGCKTISELDESIISHA